MGFIKQNHHLPEQDYTLLNAYAIIKSISINGDYGYATFAINTNRDKAFEASPFATVDIEFKVNRNENPYDTAYNEAKSVHEVTKYVTVEEPVLDKDGKPLTYPDGKPMTRFVQKEIKEEVPMYFHDWTDDIVRP